MISARTKAALAAAKLGGQREGAPPTVTFAAKGSAAAGGAKVQAWARDFPGDGLTGTAASAEGFRSILVRP
ncbi:MAG TPA: hypothetical protein VE684_12925 [Crenalkalicoccus sp.]|jgi:hypothetical protein|nr:hypothetical protein [Crenalkalicoccus sp.]